MAKIIQLSDSSGNIFPRTANGTLTSSDSIDDIKREGTYWCNAVGGKPHSNTYGFLISRTYGSGTLQTYYPYSADGVVYVYMRFYMNSTWTAWRRIATTAV